MLLQNSALTVEVSDVGSDYTRSRYDWCGIIKQVTLNGTSTFLSREVSPDGGCGLGGIGLCSVFEWAGTATYDEAPVAGLFPMIGTGLLKKGSALPFQFTADYEVTTFTRECIPEGDEAVTFHTLPYLCCGIAVEQFKTIRICGNSLTITHRLRNVGVKDIEATEFSHNFFMFNDYEVNGDYLLQLPYTICPRLRRGTLKIQRDACWLGGFDAATASSAFWLNGYEGLKEHWMKLIHEPSGHSVLIEDHFPVVRFYSWNNRYAFCPETFCRISLRPGEEMAYRRSYSFSEHL